MSLRAVLLDRHRVEKNAVDEGLYQLVVLGSVYL